jgi:indole-3-acetate monooxygenase
MNAPAHPSGIINNERIDAIRQLSAAAEQSGQLHPGQLDIIYQERWFNLFVPKQYGGLELNLPRALQVEEALAWTDGSMGWTVTLCSGANWFIGFLPPAIADRIYDDGKVCLAGSGRPSGTAKRNKKGYEVNGYWTYATGAPHATIFTANCMIEEDGKVLTDDTGQPLMRAFWFTKDEVTIQETWHTTGMIATASHDFSVTKIQIPENRCFHIHPQHAVLQDPVYHYPFLQFAEATLAVNSAGMGLRFVELCKQVLAGKQNNSHYREGVISAIIVKAEQWEQALQQARQTFYTAIERSWTEMGQTQAIQPALLQQISNSSRELAAIARQLTDELYPYCGLIAADPRTEINRVWRNIHTASQHSLLTFPHE